MTKLCQFDSISNVHAMMDFRDTGVFDHIGWICMCHDTILRHLAANARFSSKKGPPKRTFSYILLQKFAPKYLPQMPQINESAL